MQTYNCSNPTTFINHADTIIFQLPKSSLLRDSSNIDFIMLQPNIVRLCWPQSPTKCKYVTYHYLALSHSISHGRRQASPPFHALFTLLVRMLKQRIRTIHAPPPQIANRSRPFPSASKSVPQDWTKSKFHSHGSRRIHAKMSLSTW